VVAIGQVLLAAPRSFCAGVDRAIEIVEILLEQHGAPVYVRHQIVHNENVVRRLEELGAVFVEDESEIPVGEICVLSAHGVAPSVKENAKERGLRVVDATCPLVNKVHAEARRYADSGHLVALVGHAYHVEVIGPLADDICYATQNRQDAVKAMVAQGATLVLVIGSETSSNAQRLVEVAQAAGAQATLIDGESGLDPQLVEGHAIVGLTAGASTPEELVRATAARLSEVGYALPEEITVAKEDVHFRLPKEVARA
jgi:4-hydroxy-3-methylbut-2-enyl diphosphate reductase